MDRTDRDAGRGTARPQGRVARAEAVIGLGTIAFAGLVLWQTTAIPAAPVYAAVGPTLVPYMVATGLAVLGALMTVETFRGGWQGEDEKEAPLDWRALGFVIAGLVFNAVLIVPLGFTLASTGMFVLVAHGFGSRRVVRDAGIGFLLALAAYLGFAKLLGVNIGGGLVEGLIEKAVGG